MHYGVQPTRATEFSSAICLMGDPWPPLAIAIGAVVFIGEFVKHGHGVSFGVYFPARSVCPALGDTAPATAPIPWLAGARDRVQSAPFAAIAPAARQPWPPMRPLGKPQPHPAALPPALVWSQ